MAAASSALAWASACEAWLSFFDFVAEGFFAGCAEAPPELDAAEVAGTTSVEVVADAFEESGEDCPDCTACALAAAVAASEEVGALGSVEAGVGVLGVMASAEAGGVVGDEAAADEEACCDGGADLPAPASVLMRLGRYSPAANNTATTMKAPRAM